MASFVDRYFLSSNEKPDESQEVDGWLLTDLSDNPIVSFTRPRPQRGITAVNRYLCTIIDNYESAFKMSPFLALKQLCNCVFERNKLKTEM